MLAVLAERKVTPKTYKEVVTISLKKWCQHWTGTDDALGDAVQNVVHEHVMKVLGPSDHVHSAPLHNLLCSITRKGAQGRPWAGLRPCQDKATCINLKSLKESALL